jgi:hypothetical protein
MTVDGREEPWFGAGRSLLEKGYPTFYRSTINGHLI